MNNLAQRGRCCECNGLYTLTGKGNTPNHYLYKAQGLSKLPCSGSQKPPSRVTVPKGERVPLPAPIVISGKAQLFAALKDIDLESVEAFQRFYDEERTNGLGRITSNQLWEMNALVLATKGHFKHASE